MNENDQSTAYSRRLVAERESWTARCATIASHFGTQSEETEWDEMARPFVTNLR